MRYSLPCLAVLATTVSSAAVDLAKRDSPLSVKLTHTEDSKVLVSLTNAAENDYKLFYKESFLDDAPIDKLTVTSSSASAPFTGFFQRMAYTDLPEEVFKTIKAGETIEVEIELAELYELSETGTYTVSTAGGFLYAEAGTTELTGDVLAYSAEAISVDVDAEKAASIQTAVSKLSKRTIVQSDCTGTRGSAIRTAISNCRSLASNAATAAASGSATKFNEFFKSTSSSVRSTVAARFRAVANDCGSTTSGVTRTYCSDIYGACSGGVLAYTLPSANVIAYCSTFFNQLTPLTRQCYGQDQATTVLHESTHAPAVYSPGTVDNAYGYSASTRLTSSQAVVNADSYALYAGGKFSTLGLMCS
jgi:deuterolysin